MNVREKLTDLTKNCRAQTDLDALVARSGGLGKLLATEFPCVDRSEFAYEWERVQMAIRPMTRS